MKKFAVTIYFAILASGAIAQQAKPGKESDEDFIDRAIRGAPPLHLRAKVPAGFIEIAQRLPCSIEEVAEKKPSAIGGKHYNVRGDYLFVCAWIDGDRFVVVDQLGKVRLLPLEAFTPVKGGGMLFPK